jgi:hypothetical protein
MFKLLYKLSYEVFGNWSPLTIFERACDKAYFVEIGGLKLITQLVADKTVSVDVRVMGASALWNFSELDRHRRDVAMNGGLEAILAVFEEGRPELVKKITGFLWSLVEYQECQEIVARQRGVISSLMSYLDSDVNNKPELFGDHDPVRYIGVLNCLSASEVSRKTILDSVPQFLENLLSMTAGIDYYYADHLNAHDQDLWNGVDRMFLYFSVLTLANFVNDRALNVSQDVFRGVMELTSKFLVSIPFEFVMDTETRNHYTWVTIKPFVSLLSSKHKLIYRLGLFALANLTSREANRGILIQEELEDELKSFAMFFACQGSPALEIISNWKKAIKSNFDWDCPPSLTSMAKRASDGFLASNFDSDA